MPGSITTFDVDAFGLFRPGAVELHWTDTPRPTTRQLDDLIGRTWDRIKAECDRDGRLLYNGTLVRWIDHRVADGALHIDTGPTDYRDFVGTNLYNRHRVADFGRESFANPIGTTATILSDDGWLLYGRRSDRVVYHAGYVHTFGGAIEQVDIRSDDFIDAFDAVHRELDEELGLGPEHIAETVCVGLIHDHEIWQPELLFETRVRMTRDALVDRLDHDDAHQEHVAIESVRDEPDALVPYILGAAPIAPVAVGAICLHGRHRWGDGWYEDALGRISIS
jgi:hypothetical protein